MRYMPLLPFCAACEQIGESRKRKGTEVIKTLQKICATAMLLTGLCLAVCHAANDGNGQESWKPTWKSLDKHRAPEWILDAKIGIQYVGTPQDMKDKPYHEWNRREQSKRLLGRADPPVNLEEVIRTYRNVGARFLVSMRWAAYPGTEGLWILPQEVAEARRQGLKVGLHYNFIRRDGIPMIDDPGYTEWMHEVVKREIRKMDPAFLFFDGSFRSTPEKLRTPELLAWYYNRADRYGQEVLVNSDVAGSEQRAHGDIWECEQRTMSGICEHPWMNWEPLRNEWNCWINEFGKHRIRGERWEWKYKSTENLLRVLLDVVSKGGVWCVQMVNTKRAWKRMEQIGNWLDVNGEAIYGTRPLHAQEDPVHEIPEGWKGTWWERWEKTVAGAGKSGPVYFTRRDDTVYAIIWGWPGHEATIPDISAEKDSRVQLLGVDGERGWEQEGDKMVVTMPDTRPCRYAYTLKIEDMK